MGSVRRRSLESSGRMLKRLGMNWNIPITTAQFPVNGADDLEVHYIDPIDLFGYLLDREPAILFGGMQDVQKQGNLLKSWWSAFRDYQPAHAVFQTHGDALASTIPCSLYGDEGKGRRRGNTAVCSIEVPFGLHSALLEGKDEHALDCSSCSPGIHREVRNIGGYAAASMKEHSFLTRFLLWIQPCVNYKAHDGLIKWLLARIGASLRQLFFEGLTVRGRCYTFALVAMKGDQKWHISMASLARHFGTRGRKRSLQMCYECEAGRRDAPYEDINRTAAWTQTLYRSRPWDQPPPLLVVPFEPEDGRQEFLYKRDIFHIVKLGLLRHWVASTLVSLIQWGCAFTVEGEPNAVGYQLERAHAFFKMWCLAFKKSAALRSFSRNLFNWPNAKTAPWANVKASDCVLLAGWLCSVLPAYASQETGEKQELLTLMCQTGQHALDFYGRLVKHHLLMPRSCVAASLHSGLSFLKGYTRLAYCNMRQPFAAWAMVPKVHSFRHCLHEYELFLADPTKEFFINPLCWACETGEDLIGRVCRLATTLGSRYVTLRCLEFYLVKCRILWNRASCRILR